jgi:hypothetical protein
MSEQKPRILLAILLAVVSVTLLAAASYNFFPSSEPPAGTPIVPQFRVLAINGNFSIAQSESLEINLTVVLSSDETNIGAVFPLFLGSQYENQPFQGYTVIATPPSSYSSKLPWEQIDNSTESKPFTATFSPNPAILGVNETKVVNLTIYAAENATLGAYNMDVVMSTYPMTSYFATGFQLTVQPKHNP